jgi:NAD(P)-dependent dehydrogenase (short-subunit alcohol dehydrogenase family)
LATAKEFKEQGARVVITGRDQKTLDEAKREIGGDVLAVRSDTSSLTEIDKLFAAVKDLRKPDARRSSLGDKLTIGNFGKGINKIDDEVWYGMLWLTVSSVGAASALPPDVRRWLCPAVEVPFTFLGYAPWCGLWPHPKG